jgi:hypothetical protein
MNSIRRPSTRASVWKWPLSARASVTLRELEAAAAGAGAAADIAVGARAPCSRKRAAKTPAASSTSAKVMIRPMVPPH